MPSRRSFRDTRQNSSTAKLTSRLLRNDGTGKCAALIRAGQDLEISGEVYGQFRVVHKECGDGSTSPWLPRSSIRLYWLRGRSWPTCGLSRGRKYLYLSWEQTRRALPGPRSRFCDLGSSRLS